MSTWRQRLQGIALQLRVVPFADAAYSAWYSLAQKIVVRIARRAAKPFDQIDAVYLRRGGGRGELVPGASDLDFFVVLPALAAEREMLFLKRFWSAYNRWRIFFPFLGEVLMGDSSELRDWLEIPTVRSHEAHHSWLLLYGKEARTHTKLPWEPDPRDVYAEALKSYGDLLQPLIKLRDSQLRIDLAPWHPGATRMRHAAKAALDLFRLHHISSLPLSARPAFWRLPRVELTQKLPPEKYGKEVARLSPLLTLKAPLFPDAEPFELFSALALKACECLHELAQQIESAAETTEDGWQIRSHESPRVDRYSLSVRELFTERMLMRHELVLSRALLSETTTHIYLLLTRPPSLEKFREILIDLRDVSFSFDRFSLAMPLTELAFRELERTPLFDSPFHAFGGYRETSLTSEGLPSTASYRPNPSQIPSSMLVKTCAELSFALRYPPFEMEYFLERMLGLVLSLRVAERLKEISPTFHAAVTRFREAYPNRAALLEHWIAPYLPSPENEEPEFWNATFQRLSDLEARSPARARALRLQLESLAASSHKENSCPNRTSDLWINLTPFLRMEMNALRERHFRHRAPLKV